MSVEFPLDAFDDTRAIVRRRVRSRVNRSKAMSLVITAALHVTVALIAFAGSRAPEVVMPEALTVKIAREEPRPQAEVPLELELRRPPVITSIMPDVTIQSLPTAPVAEPPVPKQASQMPAPATPRAAGESRESYFNRLLAHLNRYKQYPRAARLARMQGTVMLHFVMDAQGQVLSFEIVKSSARPMLDAEALALMQRAQPLPPLPPDYPTRQLDVVVPIEFNLGQKPQ